jgi:hypothetical protein
LARALVDASVVASSGPEELRTYLDAHPEARQPLLVSTLMATARMHGDSDLTRSLIDRARCVCGEDWPEGPDVVAAVVGATLGLDELPGDPSAREAAVEAARAAERSGFPDRAHPRFVPGLHFWVSWLFRSLHGAGGEPSALQESVTAAQAAVDAAPGDDPERQLYVDNLVDCRAALEDALGDQASSREVDRPLPDPFPGGPAAPFGAALLAELLLSRPDASGSPPPVPLRRLLGADVAEAQDRVADLRAAITQVADDDPTRGDLYDGLASVQRELYGRTGREADLRQAVEDHRVAAEATPEGHPQRIPRLARSGHVHHQLYDATRSTDDLHQAINATRAALGGMPPGDPHRGPLLVVLASAQVEAGCGEGDDASARAFGEVMDTIRAAIEATPVDHPVRPERLARLALIAAESFGRWGWACDPPRDGEVRELLRSALDARARDDPAGSRQLVPLVVALTHLVGYPLAPDAWREVGGLVRAAVDALPESGDERREGLGTLAGALDLLHHRTGDRAPLDAAIDLAREAFDGRPEAFLFGDLPRDAFVAMYESLYSLTGDRALLHEAIAMTRAAFAVLTGELDDWLRINRQGELARLSQALHGATGDRAALVEAVERHQVVLDQMDADDTAWPDALETLAT